MGNTPSGEAHSDPPAGVDLLSVTGRRKNSFAIKATQSSPALNEGSSHDLGGDVRTKGKIPLSPKTRKGLFGQSVVHAVDSGMRYGLVIDMTKNKRKQGQSGKLTLFFSGELPSGNIVGMSKSTRHSKRGKVTREQLETVDGNIHILDVTKLVHMFNSCRPEQPIRLTTDAMHFSGYVDIHLNLIHPISINRPLPSRHLIVPGVRRATPTQTERSHQSVIYLRDMTTRMMIHCVTTTKEIIESLMHKYNVADDLSNFALYDCEGNQGGPGGRQMDPEEQPLLLSLVWGPYPEHSLSLQLAPTCRKRAGTMIHWDNFTLTELKNFLIMLEKEEMKHIENIEKNYQLKRERIQRHLAKFDEDGTMIESEA